MVEGLFSGKIDVAESELDKLDKAAQKAKRSLQKTPAAEFFERIEREGKQTSREADKGKKKKQLRNVLASDLGTSKANRAIGMLRSPEAFFGNLLTKQLPILGGILAAVEIVKFITKELQRKGGLFDRFFRDIVNTRVDALRDKLIQQQVVAGFTQIIITTKSGFTNPRDAYNTFELANKDRERLEDDFSVRNTSGFD